MTGQGRQNHNKQNKIKKIRMVLLVSMSVFLLALFIGANIYLDTHFMNHTMINEMDVSGMTVDQLESKMRSYALTVRQRTCDGGYVTEQITGNQIGVTVANLDSLSGVLRRQNVFRALIHLFTGKQETYQIEDLYGFSEEALDRAIQKLQCFQEEFVSAPTDAAISPYDPQSGYTIVPESEGNRLYREKAQAVISDAVTSLRAAVDLEEEQCYEKPEIYRDDDRLVRILEQLVPYSRVHITYQFGEETEIIDGQVVDGWLRIDESKAEVELDRACVDDFVVSLRKKYDTIFRARTFRTSYGKDVTVEGGDYGWWMNYTKEQEELYEQICKGESGERTPVYYQTAAAYGTKDYGNTYVEVNLTAQHLFLYVDGKRILQSDFVSGNAARSYDTPEGIYGITYKEQGAMLVGEDYETPVSYWMPFNGNIGLHDAVWRDAFGKDLYQRSGSHGCVNLPYLTAKKIYENVQKGTPVICYHLPGTESGSVTEQTDWEKAQAVVDAIDRIGEVTKDSEKKIARARQLYQEADSGAKQYVTNLSVLEAAERTYKEKKK